MNPFQSKKYALLLYLFVSCIFSIHAQTLQEEWVSCNDSGCLLLDPYYSDGVTLEWEGGCLNGKAHGFGTLTKYVNGEFESTYKGDYNNGIREGKGSFTHKDKSVAVGTFAKGQLTGTGKRTHEDGSEYEGAFVNYRQHGKGVMRYANGAKFEGFFVSDKPYTGKFTNYNGEVTYIQQYYSVKKIVEKSSGYEPAIGSRVTEYFDADWNRCKQKDAAYYRLITYEAENKPRGIIKDYFITGQLQSEFTAVYLDYDDEGKTFHEGEASWYYKSGKIEQKRFYFNNKINGVNSRYFENGQVSEEITYDHGVYHGLYQLYYKTGKPKITAYYEHGSLVDNKYLEYDENGLGALVYNENFNANATEWAVETEYSSSHITDEGYVSMNITNEKSSSRFNYITLDQNSSYSIEAIVQKKTGTSNDGYGLLFGFQDWNNYYKFLISELGYYIVVGQFEGINVNLCEWTKSDAINKGNQRNLLKVMKFGDEFIFSINGEVVERPEAKDLRGNNIGITAAGEGEYILENIIVREFKSAEEAVSEEPEVVEPDADAWLGNGSGFFINEKGYIATNYHVVAEANEIQVTYYQQGVKQSHAAKVVVTDKQNDLAIIQIEDPTFQTLPSIPYVFGTNISDVGTDVFALGYPLAHVMGEEIKFTDGKISSKTGLEGDITVYQISVPIQPGNSGGPLFDSKGNLVGITSSALNREMFGSENVNYAIKATYLKNLIDVMPESISLPNDTTIYNKSLTEKIKVLSDFTPIIRIR